MHTKFSTIRTRQNLQVFALGIVAAVSSFALGVQTAGDVRPISLIEAGSIQQSGDVDGSGEVDVRDVLLILEVAQGYRTPAPAQLRADPNGDSKLTVDDAIRILSEIAIR